MSMRPDDPILGTRGMDLQAAAAQAIAWIGRQGGKGDYATFVRTMFRDASPLGLDPWFEVARASEETNKFRSGYWLLGNAAGVGIDYSGKPSAFTTQDAAVAAHVVLLIDCAHLARPDVPEILRDAYALPGVRPLYAGSLAFATRDTGFRAALPRGVRTIRDLCTPFKSSITGDRECVHACDDSYAANICEHGNAIWPGLPASTPAAAPEEGDGMATEVPKFLVIAGHRNTTGGDPDEAVHTPAMARAYGDALQAAGYEAHYLQAEDGDGKPDDTAGGLDLVGQQARDVMAARTGFWCMIDCHFAGDGGPRGVFAIYPNSSGLGTAIAGDQTPDAAGNNPWDQRFGVLLAQKIAAATGLQLRTAGCEQPGLMSEQRTGVALQYGARLAMFAYTVGLQSRAIRLVVEHGDIAYDKAVNHAPDFPGKCAAALAQAVKEFWPDAVPATPAATTTPAPKPQPKPSYAPLHPVAGEQDFVSNEHGYIRYPQTLTVGGKPLTPREYATPAGKAAGADLAPGSKVAIGWVCRGDDGELWVVVDSGALRGARLPLSGFAESGQVVATAKLMKG